MRGCLFKAAERLKHGPDIVVAVGNPTVQCNRFADQVNRDVASAGLVGENAEELQAHDMIGIGN